MATKSKLPNATDYSMVIFETNDRSDSINNVDSDLFTMEISLSHGHPEVYTNIFIKIYHNILVLLF